LLFFIFTATFLSLIRFDLVKTIPLMLFPLSHWLTINTFLNSH
jgi:hypothetical protein